MVAIIAGILYFTYMGEASNVHVSGIEANRPDPLASEVEVSFLLSNDGSCDAYVVVEYWLGSQVRGVGDYDIDSGRSRTISKTFGEPDDGNWDVRVIEVMLR